MQFHWKLLKDKVLLPRGARLSVLKEKNSCFDPKTNSFLLGSQGTYGYQQDRVVSYLGLELFSSKVQPGFMVGFWATAETSPQFLSNPSHVCWEDSISVLISRLGLQTRGYFLHLDLFLATFFLLHGAKTDHHCQDVSLSSVWLSERPGIKKQAYEDGSI